MTFPPVPWGGRAPAKLGPAANLPWRDAVKNPPKHPGGPHLIPIDIEEVEKLAALQCTFKEAAAWFDCSLSTFKRRMRLEGFRDAWERGRDKGLVSLRRHQFTLSARNATMAIWLGKQWLGQKDILVNEFTGADGGPIEISAARREFESRIDGIASRRAANVIDLVPDRTGTE